MRNWLKTSELPARPNHTSVETTEAQASKAPYKASDLGRSGSGHGPFDCKSAICATTLCEYGEQQKKFRAQVADDATEALLDDDSFREFIKESIEADRDEISLGQYLKTFLEGAYHGACTPDAVADQGDHDRKYAMESGAV